MAAVCPRLSDQSKIKRRSGSIELFQVDVDGQVQNWGSLNNNTGYIAAQILLISKGIKLC